MTVSFETLKRLWLQKLDHLHPLLSLFGVIKLFNCTVEKKFVGWQGQQLYTSFKLFQLERCLRIFINIFNLKIQAKLSGSTFPWEGSSVRIHSLYWRQLHLNHSIPGCCVLPYMILNIECAGCWLCVGIWGLKLYWSRLQYIVLPLPHSNVELRWLGNLPFASQVQCGGLHLLPS